MKKYLRITEFVWMILACLCVGITVYYFIVGDNDNGVFAMVVTLLAGVMYSLRRRFNRYIIQKQKELEKMNEGK
jgi:hypothetical protein